MKWRSARSPNPTSAIWTPGGYQRDKIGKLGPLEMRRRADGRQDVRAQRKVEHLLLDHTDQRCLPGLHPVELGGVRPSSSPRLSENCAYRYSHISPCSSSQA